MKDTEKTPKEYGSLGGNTTLKKYGKDHFSRIAKKRWSKKKV